MNTGISSGILKEQKTFSELVYRPLDDSENLKAIHTFKMLIQSCYGPSGKLKMIQNSCGGYVSITSSSGRLFDSLSVSKPILKLVIEAVKGHLSKFNDAGLFLTILCCELIEGGSKGGIPKSLLVNLNEYILNLCLEYLKSSNCQCKIQLNIKSTEQLLALVQNVLKTKSACCLSSLEVKSLSCTILQSYLFTLSQVSKSHSGCNNILFLTVEGKSAFESKVYPGILFEIPKSSISELNWFYSQQNSQSRQQFKIALFNISLAGDSDEFLEAQYEVTFEVSPQAVIVKKILKLSKHLVQNGVNIVACQKVIHPHVKKFLYDHHVLVIDRLSIRNIGIFQQLTGAVPISAITDTIPENCYGYVDNASIQIFHNKTFLHLICDQGSVCTLVLCNRYEETLVELKHVCKNALHVIELALLKPEVVIGGGCLEVHLSQIIQEQLSLNMPQIISTLSCSQAQLLEAGCLFQSALKAVAMACNPNSNDHIIDSQECHLWTSHKKTPLPDNEICACQMVIKKHLGKEVKWQFFKENNSFQRSVKNKLNKIELKITNDSAIDLLSVKVNALCIATEVANLILSLGMLIQDKN